MNKPVTMFAILFIAAVAMATVSATNSPSPSPSPQPYEYEEFDVGIIVENSPSPQAFIEDFNFVFPLGGSDPNQLSGCWNTLTGVEGCVRDLLQSLLTFHVQLGPQCCKVVHDIGTNCFQSIFANLPFNPFFAPLVQNFCAASPKNV